MRAAPGLREVIASLRLPDSPPPPPSPDAAPYVPGSRRAVAIIPAENEEATIGDVVHEVKQLGELIQTVIVVSNGSEDRTAEVAQAAGAYVVRTRERLGHDVGRAVGVREAGLASVYLFLDGDVPVRACDLRPFLWAVGAGADVALNDIAPFVARRGRLGNVTLAQLFLNVALGRPELGLGSLTLVPHALSRRAVEVAGLAGLCVPPKALVAAALNGLRIVRAHSVDILRHNPRRARSSANHEPGPIEQLILGDHLEAIAHLLSARGPRAGFTELGRQRSALGP